MQATEVSNELKLVVYSVKRKLFYPVGTGEMSNLSQLKTRLISANYMNSLRRLNRELIVHDSQSKTVFLLSNGEPMDIISVGEPYVCAKTSEKLDVHANRRGMKTKLDFLASISIVQFVSGVGMAFGLINQHVHGKNALKKLKESESQVYEKLNKSEKELASVIIENNSQRRLIEEMKKKNIVTDKLEKNRTEIQQEKEESAKLKNKVIELNEQKEDFTKKVQTLQSEVVTLRSKEIQSKNEADNLINKVIKLKSQLDSTETALTQVRTKMRESELVATEFGRIHAKVSDLNLEIEELKDTINQLEHENHGLKKYIMILAHQVNDSIFE